MNYIVYPKIHTTMSENETKSNRTYKKLGYSKEESSDIVQALNELLANYHIHYQKLRNYHWNVRGGDFFDIHEKFEQLYDEAKLNIDEIAERIRVFGHRPTSTLGEYLEIAEIKETPTEADLSGGDMVSEILQDFEILLSYLVDAADAAIEVGDVGTEDMVKGFIKSIEKSHWMFTAFTSED